MRLAACHFGEVSPSVGVPRYDREAQENGIVHFGLGAFARAHLAHYTDKAMSAGERDWMITGVSLRSPAVAAQVNPQDGLFSLTENGETSATRVVGSLREVLVGGDDDEAIIAAIASPSCHIVSFTVTEKGYCRASDDALDFDTARASFYPLLAASLRRRREKGGDGLTLLSCDNLSGNGAVLHSLLFEWLQHHDAGTAQWFSQHCTTPSTMIDRIVPAPDAACRHKAADSLGMVDEAAVATEPFTQWVVEDRFAGPRPTWEDHGAQLTHDVEPYETAKLRMLNGAHSLLAYAGLTRGHVYVHQAIVDQWLRDKVRQLMLEEAAPTIRTADGQELYAYAEALVRRFENPALEHRLAQIAMDGSQKLPQRWLATLAEARAQCPAILTGIAAWLLHIDEATALDDPVADRLREIVASGDVANSIEQLFGDTGLLASDWQPLEKDIACIASALVTLKLHRETIAC